MIFEPADEQEAPPSSSSSWEVPKAARHVPYRAPWNTEEVQWQPVAKQAQQPKAKPMQHRPGSGTPAQAKSSEYI